MKIFSFFRGYGVGATHAYGHSWVSTPLQAPSTHWKYSGPVTTQVAAQLAPSAVKQTTHAHSPAKATLNRDKNTNAII